MDIRSEQRFSNLEKAVEQPSCSLLEMGGLLQRFKFTFELTWKILKDT